MENVQKMLLAVEIRKLAQDIRIANRQAYAKTLSEEILDDSKKYGELIDKWFSDNPVENFFEKAYNRIATVADRLDDLERSRMHKQLEGNRYAQASRPLTIADAPKENPSE